MSRTCYACKRAEDHSLNEQSKFKVELRPYGPGGALVCFECATKPENIKTTVAVYRKKLEACGPATQLTPEGPIPMIVPRGK